MDAFLTGKTVLFIGPVFYDYTHHLVRGLESLGARVLFVNEQPRAGYDVLYSLAQKASAALLAAYCNGPLRRRLDALAAEPVDVVFVLRGETITTAMLETLRRHHPAARFVYYNWDSLAVKPNALRIWPVFDMAFSFDRADCERYPQFRYLPMFFVPAAAPVPAASPTIDVLFVGNEHSDRLAVLREVARQVREVGYRFEARILSSGWKMLLRRWRGDVLTPFYMRTPIPLAQAQVLMASARVLVDIHHLGQSGLTQRTYESLHLGLKLITTNERVKQEPFYDPRQILVIDRRNPRIDPAFLSLPGRRVDVSGYGVLPWLTNLFHPAPEPLSRA
jgi:hypothetical protein